MRHIIGFLLAVLLLAALLSTSIIAGFEQSEHKGITGTELKELRDSILISETKKSVYTSFNHPLVDSLLNIEASRRADSQFVARMAAFD
jgi:hypothetical protein